MDTTPQAVIDARVIMFRAALEAVAAEGLDPARTSITTYHAGRIDITPTVGAKGPADVARRILARLIDAEPTRHDYPATPEQPTPFSTWTAGGVLVYAEYHRDDTADGAR